jgi:hypothetical protein
MSDTLEPGDIAVTSQSHPLLYSAFESISHDSGGGAGHPYHRVPARFVDGVEVAESALATLNPDEFETFCIGDQCVADVIAKRSPDLQRTHDFLNTFFDEWTTEAGAPIVVYCDPSCAVSSSCACGRDGV